MMLLVLGIQTLVKSEGSLSPSDNQESEGTVRRAEASSLVNRPLDWAKGLFSDYTETEQGAAVPPMAMGLPGGGVYALTVPHLMLVTMQAFLIVEVKGYRGKGASTLGRAQHTEPTVHQQSSAEW